MFHFLVCQAAKLQEDNRALDRLTKSKEDALVEAEKTVQMALAKAALVDDLQNKNQELMKQIEICQVCPSLKILLLQGGIKRGTNFTCLVYKPGGEQNPRQNASTKGCGGRKANSNRS